MFEVENHSPFPCFAFEKTGYGNTKFDVVCIKTSYRIQPGGRSDLADEQSPLVMTDAYTRTGENIEPESSSLIVETDLVLGKPNTDVHVIGHARPPSGLPSARWIARVRISSAAQTAPTPQEPLLPPKPEPLGPGMRLTSQQLSQWEVQVAAAKAMASAQAERTKAAPAKLLLDKQLIINGSRFWQHRTLRGWALSESQPALAVPLQYELAYGGSFNTKTGQPVMADPENEAINAYEFNPVGMGYADKSKRDKSKNYHAAQFESPTDLIKDIDTHYKPQGFGPINRWWSPRKQFAGTYDAHWLDTQAPGMPNDFEFDFYNSAHPDMVIPGYLKGDEWIELTGFLGQGTVRTQLAAYEFVAVLNSAEGRLITKRPQLDTLTIDTDKGLILGTWRMVVPRSLGTKYCILGSIVPPPYVHAPGEAQPIVWAK
jgi:hypothetical protein